jgi:hypothetical protein
VADTRASDCLILYYRNFGVSLPNTILSKFRGLVDVSVLTKGGEAIPNPDNFAHYPDTSILSRSRSRCSQRGGRRSQIQTTSPTIRNRPHITPIEQIRGVGSHKGGRNAGFEVLVLTKGG